VENIVILALILLKMLKNPRLLLIIKQTKKE